MYAALAAAYDEPHRHYHSAGHIRACLAVFDSVAAQAQAPDDVELALWFHDAVYDAQAPSGDNEERSALWAEQALTSAGVLAARALRVGALVRATRGHEASDPDMALLIGVDLSILGAPADTFDAFDDAIRVIATEGRLLVLGFAAGGIPTVKVNRLLLRNIGVLGVGYGEFVNRTPGAQGKIGAGVADLVAAGLRPPPPMRFPLSDGAAALQSLGDGGILGKVVLEP